MYIYIYIYIYMHISVYIYTYINIHIYIKGSAFWFTFPYRPDHLMQSFEFKEDIRKASLKIGVVEKSVKLRILLIDDSTTVQKVIHMYIYMYIHIYIS
jgi:hypothetical protein